MDSLHVYFVTVSIMVCLMFLTGLHRPLPEDIRTCICRKGSCECSKTNRSGIHGHISPPSPAWRCAGDWQRDSGLLWPCASSCRLPSSQGVCSVYLCVHCVCIVYTFYCVCASCPSGSVLQSLYALYMYIYFSTGSFFNVCVHYQFMYTYTRTVNSNSTLLNTLHTALYTCCVLEV